MFTEHPEEQKLYHSIATVGTLLLQVYYITSPPSKTCGPTKFYHLKADFDICVTMFYDVCVIVMSYIHIPLHRHRRLTAPTGILHNPPPSKTCGPTNFNIHLKADFDICVTMFYDVCVIVMSYIHIPLHRHRRHTAPTGILYNPPKRAQGPQS